MDAVLLHSSDILCASRMASMESARPILADVPIRHAPLLQLCKGLLKLMHKLLLLLQAAPPRGVAWRLVQQVTQLLPDSLQNTHKQSAMGGHERVSSAQYTSCRSD
jgi:hypothetical protein